MEIFDYTNYALITLGFLLIAAELLLGIDSLFDLVLSGISLILGGFLGLILDNNIAIGMAISMILLIMYFVLFRSKVQKKLAVAHHHTNVDKLIDSETKIEKIMKNGKYVVKIDGEHWSASCESKLEIGDKVKVIQVHGSMVEIKQLID